MNVVFERWTEKKHQDFLLWSIVGNEYNDFKNGWRKLKNPEWLYNYIFRLGITWILIGSSTCLNHQGAFAQPVSPWKAKHTVYFKSVSVTLVMQHSNCMRNNTFSPVACLAVPYYSTLSRTRQKFRKKDIEHQLVFYFSAETFT